MAEESQQTPKIIIDEDWKEQVQREKELASKDPAETTSDSRPTAPSESAQVSPEKESVADSPDDLGQLPMPSFEFLVTMLATQAMVALGQMPGATGKLEKRQKPLAKHYIDLLGVLEDKTKGNLSADEQRLLTTVLHQLRMAFVQS